jgi:hypothetical protein
VKQIQFQSESKTVKMGDNVDSDLLYDEFDNNDRKEFDNVRSVFVGFSACFPFSRVFAVVGVAPMGWKNAFSFTETRCDQIIDIFSRPNA